MFSLSSTTFARNIFSFDKYLPCYTQDAGLEKDLHNISIRNWKNIALDRSRWRRCLEQAKTHPGL
jgi:hypothetical protein